jgi:hypothetical protein
MGDSLINADVGVFSILETIRDKYGGVGKNMEKQAGTIKGLFSTLSSAPADFFLNMETGVDAMPGLVAFKGALQNLITVLDTGNASGQRIMSTIEGVFNRLLGTTFKDLSGPEGLKKMEDLIVRLVEGAGRLADAFIKIADSLVTLAGVAKRLGVFDPILNMGQKGVARSMLDGLITGLEWTNPGAMAAKYFMEGFNGPEGQDAHSPSRKFETFGRWGAEGYVEGFQGLGLQNVLPETTSPISNGGARIGSITVPITIPVDARGMDAESFVQKLREMLPIELASALEQFAIEGGQA